MTVRSLVLNVISACAVLTAVMPATAGAYATTGAPPSRSGVSGLPDGRVYEEVSPPNKHGNEVGTKKGRGVAVASPDGEAIMYESQGALAEASSNGLKSQLFVSERMGSGWVTRSAMPLPPQGVNSEEEYATITDSPTWIDVSSDLSHLLFGIYGPAPYVGPPDAKGLNNNIYLEGPNPFVEPEWIARPQIEAPAEGLSEEANPRMFIAGGSPDLSTIYFYYANGLLAPEVSHLYEYRDGVLSDAGVLPGGEAGSSNAAPVAQPLVQRKEFQGITSTASYDNEVSEDGSRIFFTREDHAGTLELYVHITAPDGSGSTTLVSRSELAGHEGEAAPHGPGAMPSTEWMNHGIYEEPEGQQSPPSYAYASPDGSHVFFQSVDRLTEEAPEDSATKTYDFSVETNALEYLPGVTGSIVTSSHDGSSLVFENTSTSPSELDRWEAGAGGGSVRPIAQLPSVYPNACKEVVCVGPAYTSSGGSVVVFSTESPISGFNDGGTHFEREPNGHFPPGLEGPVPNKEIFRYDTASDELSCVSCPPTGVAPTGDAVISNMDEADNDVGATGGVIAPFYGRGMSAGGNRVFFDTPDALVGQDVNGVRDVYEWEYGTVFLVSSGRSPDISSFLDASESGDDVFFSTSEGIAPGDTDGGYDVYDARIPRPGDTPPQQALPCEGDACQGPPSTPNLLSAPPSATFNGVGDIAPQPAARPATKTKSSLKKKRKGARPRRSGRTRPRRSGRTRPRRSGRARPRRRERPKRAGRTRKGRRSAIDSVPGKEGGK